MKSFMCRVLITLGGVAAASLWAIRPANAFNLISNGNFETTSATGIPQWNTSGNVQTLSLRPSEGRTHALFNTGNTQPNGQLSQSFLTTAGVLYELSFDFGKYAEPGFGAGIASLNVSINGNSTLLSESISDSVASNTAPALYDSFRFNFTGDGSLTTLTFADTSDNGGINFDPHLDNVVVQAQSTQVPTPALLPGLIGTGVAAIRKRQQSNGKKA